jgi:cell division protein ZapA
MEKTRTTVRIGGRDYTIVGEDPPEHIKRVSVYVNRKMDELSYQARLPQPMVAVLTAMNIANDLIKAQDENTKLRRELMETRTKMAINEK